MKRVVILGATGMLGSSVLHAFADFNGELFATARSRVPQNNGISHTELNFDASKDSISSVLNKLETVDYIINCIGIIKPYIDDKIVGSRQSAIVINSEFPCKLASWAEKSGAKVIQIATDCVYSGIKGGYIEDDVHDALDVYGKTKSLGEAPSDSMMHLRVSIIGPEVQRTSSLLEWVRTQPENSEIFGFQDHLWNGITTAHFGKIARGIIDLEQFKAGTFHIVPENKVTKAQLVSLIAEVFHRNDLTITLKNSGNLIDRTLATVFPDLNSDLWKCAGYSNPPSIEQMLLEISP